MIYFDNAATTKMSDAALDALYSVSKLQYGNPSSSYSHGRNAKGVLEEARAIIATCIGASPEEVFFTSCGTESDNWAIHQAYEAGINRIVTSNIEHHAVLEPTSTHSRLGMRAFYLNVNAQCIIQPAELVSKLDGQKTLVSIMFQNNETGAKQDIKELARITHSDCVDSVFHTDAVQAVGHTHIDVKELDVDMLSASAHKFNGPKGVGFLYAKENKLTSPLIRGGGQEKGLRSGTENVAGIYSMAIALKENCDQLKENTMRISRLEQLLLGEMKKAGIQYHINADSSNRAIGILNIAFDGIDGEGLLNMLDMHDICISIGSACTSDSKERSHVLKAMGLDDSRIDSSVRISMGRYNTENDVAQLVQRIKAYYDVVRVAN